MGLGYLTDKLNVMERKASESKLFFVVLGIVVGLSVTVPIVLVYLGYKEPEVVCNSTDFQLKGLYGMDIPISEIARADTITQAEMPRIKLRTNGISLWGVNRGHFKTKDGDKIRLSIKSGVYPVIRIVDKEGKQYYINRKDPAETRKIFSSLKASLE